MRKQEKDKNVVEQLEDLPPLYKLKQQERIDIIAKELVKMRSKKSICLEYAEKWECGEDTIRVIIKEALVWMAKVSTSTTEEVRVQNSERLDGLLDEAENLKDKVKIIDMINKTNNVYVSKVQVGNQENETIKIDIGV